MRFHVKERALGITDSFVVTDERGNRAYEVKGDILRIGDTFSIRDANTNEEVLFIKQVIFANSRQYNFISNGAEVATVEKKERPLPYGGRYAVTSRDGMDFEIVGNFTEWDFEVLDHYGRTLGHISKEFSILGDKYTVDVVPGVDSPFMIALAVLLDEAHEDGDRDEA